MRWKRMVVFFVLCLSTALFVVISQITNNSRQDLRSVPSRLKIPSSPSPPPTSPQRLALLFTTFSNTPAKYKIFVNTIKNWATFMPAIQPVLFTTNLASSLNVMAREHGWLVVPGTKVSEYGPPFLKPMYTTAYTIGKAKLYGYANGDILFDRNLTQTLQAIANYLPFLNTTLVIGRRWNIVGNCSADTYDVWTPQDVTTLTRNSTITELDKAHAIDYFFVSRDFPWHEFKDVIIGRVAFDTYIHARSNQLKLSTVGATHTVTALHQCGLIQDRLMNVLSDENLNYNILHIGKNFKYFLGQIDCSKLVTEYDVNGDIYTRARKHKKYPSGKRRPMW